MSVPSESPVPASGVAPERGHEPSPVTARQRDIIALVVEGLTNIEIARHLQISDRTVQSHVASAMRRLGATSRTQLAVIALRAGLVPLHPSDGSGDGATGDPGSAARCVAA